MGEPIQMKYVTHRTLNPILSRLAMLNAHRLDCVATASLSVRRNVTMEIKYLVMVAAPIAFRTKDAATALPIQKSTSNVIAA
jgi:hypothetical protein